MRNKKKIASLSVYGIFWVCSLFFWAGCTSEEFIGGSSKDDGTAIVTLALSSAPMMEGDNEIETKNATDEVAPEANELMYSATVFVCDLTGKIVAKVSTGNLANKTKHSFPDEIDLKAGDYKLYGFANCENLPELADILKSSVGSTLPAGVTSNTLVIDDPAGKIDLKNGKYIPMTGAKQVTVTTSTTTLSVEVDRLVSKAKFKISYPEDQDVTDDITLASLTLEGNRKKVPLFSKGNEHDPGDFGDKIDLLSLIPDGKTMFKVGDGVELPNLYLNESPLRNLYKLKMKVKEDQEVGQDEVFRYGTFNRRMTRNHVRPITIEIRNIKLAVEGKYYNNPIGAELEGVEFGTNYTLEMQEGSTFDLKLHLKSRGKDVNWIDGITWSHTLEGKGWLTEEKTKPEEGDDNVSYYTLEGAVPANGVGSGEARINITATYPDPNRPGESAYNKVLNFTLYLKRTALSPDRKPSTKSLLRGFSWEDIIEM